MKLGFWPLFALCRCGTRIRCQSPAVQMLAKYLRQARRRRALFTNLLTNGHIGRRFQLKSPNCDDTVALGMEMAGVVQARG
jgi:hypothetical protein